MDESLHTFTIKTTFAHEDEGTASSSAASVIKIVENVENTFPGVVTSRQLSRSKKVILEPKGFTSGDNKHLVSMNWQTWIDAWTQHAA